MAAAAGSTIGALRVVIGADTTGLQRGLKETQSGMEGVGRSAASVAKRVAAAGAAFAAVAGAIAYMVRGESNLIASQAKLARSIDGTITGLRTLNMAAADNGIDGMDAALNRMNRRLGAAAMGTGPAAAAVEALGLNLKEINELDVDEKMALIADRIKESGMSSQEAARHLQNLGFQQAEAATFFMQGGDAIRKARQEVERYGLAVDEASAAKLEDITTQWTRISTALAGVRTQLTLALLPALESIGNLVESAAQALARLTPYITRIVTLFGQVAEAVGVAGLALAGFYAPTVLAGLAAATGGVAAFAKAVAVGAVGAVKALTAAMLANPIGAITAALIAAGYAAYKFRDQISEAIGVDVVEVAKTAANTVLNSFVAAYEDIKFVWNNFGDMMGGAVVGGINVAIRAINRLITGALSGINSLVDAVNKIPGVDIGQIGDSAKIELMNNEYSSRLVDAVKERNAKIAEIMSTDRFAGSGETALPPVGAPSSSGDFAGGGVAEGAGGAGAGDSAAAIENDQLQQRLENLREFLATREELEVQAGIDRVDLIEKSLEAGLISEQEHNQMLYDVAGKFYDSMSKLREEKYQEQRDKLAELNELDIISDAEYHARKMELLAEQEQEKTDALIEAYLRRKEMLDEMIAEGDISEEEHQRHMEELEEAHQEALTRIVAQGAQARNKLDEEESKQRQAVMSGMMGNLVQLMNSGNKEMFRIGKIAAIAQALLAGREAVVSSYKVGARIGGPPLGAAFAATAAAATAAQIASVKSTTFGGGGGASGGGGSGGGYGRPTDAISNPPVEPEPQALNTSVTINLQGESYSRQQVRDLIEQINEATADGATLRLA